MARTITGNPGVAGSRRPLIIALILGAVAAGLVVAFLASRDNGGSQAVITAGTVSVVVARNDVPVGTKITEDMVEVKQIPATAAISDPVSDLKEIVGQVSRFPVNSNEQFSRGRLIQAPQAKSLSFSVPQGLRGVAVPVDKTTSPTELLSPGDFVDVIVSGNAVNLAIGAQSVPAAAANGTNFKAAVTLLQNVQVLSIEKNFVNNGVPYDSTVRGTPDDKTSGTYVTLALAPDQAQLLWLTIQEGKVTLTLRSFGDSKIAELSPIAEPVRIK
jgi:pilus assembly protein CpaB